LAKIFVVYLLILPRVNIWNNLPNHVVDVNTVILFKARLDRFWMNQDRCQTWCHGRSNRNWR